VPKEQTAPSPSPEPGQYSDAIGRSVDNTSLGMYMECPRKYYYGMVLNYRKSEAAGTTPSLGYGTTWHKILEAHYKSGGDQTLVELAAEASWQDHGNPDDHRTLERAKSAYRAYLERWGDHRAEGTAWGRTVGWPENPLVEIVTEVSWPGCLHPYTVKIDRIFEHQGLYYVEDHKTTSGLGPFFFQQFDPSNQMMGYAKVAGLVTGLPIAGVRINAHGILKTQNKFERSTVMYSPERLEEWSRNYNHWINRLEISSRQVALSSIKDPEGSMISAAFPRNFNACAAKYGQCQYSGVCTMPARLRARTLEAEFVRNPWNPLELNDAD
jgi:hypothetical protein